MIKVYISSNPAALETALNTYVSTATVEAEYGDTVVLGSVLTLAHHGLRASRPCPCSLPNLPYLGIEAVGISHVDLDTIGGILAILGKKPAALEFWETAAAVDVQGVHKVGISINPSSQTLDKLNAFWAWSESNRLSPPRDGSVQDCSDFFRAAEEVLEVLLGSTSYEELHRLIDAGREWAAAKAQLDEDSLVDDWGVVLVRSSDQFTNHLYRSSRAVVAFNQKFKSVTVSLADPIPGISCREIVQRLWGPEAGGHDGIAGSPRGTEMILADAQAAAAALVKALEEATNG